ncbi:MAG: transporter permease [Dehalococcoidia bacterium]|nr:transporter permease [Dehalococcoidia bacterium]
MSDSRPPVTLMELVLRYRRRIFLLAFLLYLVLLGVDLATEGRILPPTAYAYLLFLLLLLFYALPPLYSSRRLTRYYWERTRRHRLALLGLGFIFLLVAVALVGPFLTADPTRVNFKEKSLPPVGFSTEQFTFDITTGQIVTKETPGTWSHPLGTDGEGRDMVAMLVSGARVSLQVGLLATGIAIFLGVVLGIVSAYLGGWVDNALMRFTDIMMTFPFFLLLIFIVYRFGQSLELIILAIGLTGWTGTARLVRSEALSLRTRDFVVAARALGASGTRIVFRHLIPNTVSTIIVIATLSIPGIIVAESALSFIGLGDPTVASWGRTLSAGQRALDTAWWIAVEPGIVLFLTVLAFNFLGDGMRDAFDPRSEA